MMTMSKRAKWTRVDVNDSFVQYVDLATIRRSGNTVKMWDLRDFKRAQTVAEKTFLSGKYHEEYDCKEEKSRILAIIWFSGKMGNVPVVYADSDAGGKWNPVPPGSVNETLWKIACGKK